ncbi:MAG: transketolase, partial [bacterium]|nr:transketolase [bacterium]
ADYVRYLALECIQRANSGHPGLPLGCADLGVLLYRYILRYNPEEPLWPNRDRFILSAGHGSMLLYPLLHGAGYDITREDMENFRQLDSKTPGHPEYELEYGIETTTGPLGQGFANAVGAAVEGKMLAQRFNKKDSELFDYTVYTLMGDGCNMEGISYEAGSMAGHLGLDNLIAIYDSNHITIDGKTDITFTEDVGKRYEALGWFVDKADITDIQAVFTKLQKLKELKGKPKMLIVTTTIGEGLDKKKDTNDIHGAPAGIDEIAYFIQNSSIKEIFEKKYTPGDVADKGKLKEILTKRLADKEPLLSFEKYFDFMRAGHESNKALYNEWLERFNSRKKSFPIGSVAGKFEIPASLRDSLLNYSEPKATATRGISGKLLILCGNELPQMVGGVADLLGSTKAKVEPFSHISRNDFSGRNIAFGVREHAMAAIGNGLALNRTMIPFTSTFFTFFDYMKPSVRLAALMKLNHLFIFSHDSIYVGEDGPTHQPIEHLNSLRLLPGMYTFRPGNDIETAFSYLYFFKHMNGPMALITSRQNMAEEVMGVVPGGLGREALFEKFAKGGYVLYETGHTTEPDMVFCASGSEVSLALAAAKLVEERDKKKVRVVSIPCLELLNEADDSYKKELFNQFKKPVVMIEAASHRGINFFYGQNVILVDIETFGKSAPGKIAGEEFGFTAESVYKAIH